MNRSKLWLAFLAGALLLGCNKPCETTSQCGGDEVCAAAICQTLSCETAMFATDPGSGACVALSGCFLTDAQRGWKTCSADPCAGLGEPACVDDARCQPAYANPNVQLPSGGPGEVVSQVACGGGVAPAPDLGDNPNGIISAPGVNNGEGQKHPQSISFSCFPDTARVYAGCRAVPQIAPRPSCASLTKDACAARRDCSQQPVSQPSDPPTPGPIVFNGPNEPAGLPINQACFDRVKRSTQCDGADTVSCLTNPSCQAIGSSCYCPPGGTCACDGGGFIGCETNDRLRRCHSAADCKGGERCDNDEACIAPRTYSSPPSGADAVPGTGSCLGACVPSGCAGYGEDWCNDRPECDAGSYATVCRPKPYCSGGMGNPNTPPPPGAMDASGDLATSCGCEAEFQGCATLAPQAGIRPERSLLVRDPDIVTDPDFALGAVLTRLAPAGQADAFVQGWLQQITADQQLPNGSTAPARKGFSGFYADLQQSGQLTLSGLASLFHATSLVNRLDLATAQDCGEARITYALGKAYSDGNQRMTIIVELRVPDDGDNCRVVAQRWGELSLIDDPGSRLGKLRAIFDPLLNAASLGQVRTNEFINRTGIEPWELREWHINAQSGMLELAPVKQTVDPRFGSSPDLLSWAQQNLSALQAGTALIPAQFLGAASRENGGRIQLSQSGTDSNVLAAEKALNQQACAGCHLTETQSPFAHVGERLGQRMGSGYVPSGRAVIDEFLQKELPKRAQNLQHILTAPVSQAITPPWRSLIQARVH